MKKCGDLARSYRHFCDFDVELATIFSANQTICGGILSHFGRVRYIILQKKKSMKLTEN